MPGLSRPSDPALQRYPTAAWVIQQLREAFPYEPVAKYLIFDRDSIFSKAMVGLSGRWRYNPGCRHPQLFVQELLPRRYRGPASGRTVQAHLPRHDHLPHDVHRPDDLGDVLDSGDATEAEGPSAL